MDFQKPLLSVGSNCIRHLTLEQLKLVNKSVFGLFNSRDGKHAQCPLPNGAQHAQILIANSTTQQQQKNETVKIPDLPSTTNGTKSDPLAFRHTYLTFPIRLLLSMASHW
jgi:hypothetical protein